MLEIGKIYILKATGRRVRASAKAGLEHGPNGGQYYQLEPVDSADFPAGTIFHESEVMEDSVAL